ncbi:MAG: FxsA family protein [Pseudomonadota bacterium]
MPLLFILFIAMPIIEIWVLIEVGSKIGVLNTIGLVILTAIVGTAMLRSQGLSMLARVRQQMANNQLPATEILEGMMLVIGGALLLTPGFVTDAIGFMCLLPFTRQIIVAAAVSRFTVRGFSAYQSNGNHHGDPGARQPRSSDHTRNGAIEGEFRRED